jgi:hypothetical protein
MLDEELVVEFALTRLDNPDPWLEEIAALVVRRVDADRMLHFASGASPPWRVVRRGVPSAVERVLRVMLTLRGAVD